MSLPIAAIYMAQEGKCFHCGSRMFMSAAVRTPSGSFSRGWTREHVIPLSKGGRRGHQNIVLAHKKCNEKRGNSTPDESMLRRAGRIQEVAKDMSATINVKQVADDPKLRDVCYVHYRNYDPGPGEPKFDPEQWRKQCAMRP